MDYGLSFAAMIVLMPFLLVLFTVASVDTGFPGIFRQKRIGREGKIFIIYKFKTYHSKTFTKSKIGCWLRKTKLDELPQLFNVLKGDMSFIGPRPLLPEYLPYYNEIQKQRHSVKPGITGLAQFNGRNLTTWEKRFEMDIYYVKNVSFRLDIKIFFNTMIKVLRSEGISAEGHATMPKFSDYVKGKTAK